MKTPRQFAKTYYDMPSGMIDPTSYQLERMVAERDAEWQERVDTNRPTLRQQYAMAALTAIANDPFFTNRSDPPEVTSKMIAKEAFAIADAMIAQEAKE